MEVPVNYLAVLLAGISNMVIGAIWYGPLFGKQWAKMAGVKMGDKSPMAGYIIGFISALVMAYVMAHFVWLTAQGMGGELTVSNAVSTAFWAWLGFVATIATGAVSWEGKPWAYWCIVAGYWIVSLAVMGAIIGYLQ